MRVVMAVSVEPELAVALKALAAQRGWSENKIIKEALKEFIERVTSGQSQGAAPEKRKGEVS